jgi:uncharacterized surface protein with fasciclin (FAS1) repeats
MAMRFALLGLFAWLFLLAGPVAHADQSAQADVAATTGPAVSSVPSPALPVDDKSSDTVGQGMAESKLTTFANALLAAGMTDELNGKMPITVYAPTNDAFKAMPAGKLDNLLKPENKPELVSFLKAHMVQGIYDNATMRRMDAAGGSADVPTKADTNLHFRITGNNDLTVTDMMGTEALVEPTEIKGNNGVIEIIDKVLVAPEDLP